MIAIIIELLNGFLCNTRMFREKGENCSFFFFFGLGFLTEQKITTAPFPTIWHAHLLNDLIYGCCSQVAKHELWVKASS